MIHVETIHTLVSVWEHLYTGGMWFSHANTKIFETPPSNKKLKKGIPANLSDYIFLPAMGNYTNGKLNSFRTYGFYWLKTPYPYDSEIAFNLFFKENEADLSNMSNRSNRYKLWTSE